jgi:hypothetical protein
MSPSKRRDVIDKALNVSASWTSDVTEKAVNLFRWHIADGAGKLLNVPPPLSLQGRQQKSGDWTNASYERSLSKYQSLSDFRYQCLFVVCSSLHMVQSMVRTLPRGFMQNTFKRRLILECISIATRLRTQFTNLNSSGMANHLRPLFCTFCENKKFNVQSSCKISANLLGTQISRYRISNGVHESTSHGRSRKYGWRFEWMCSLSGREKCIFIFETSHSSEKAWRTFYEFRTFCE